MHTVNKSIKYWSICQFVAWSFSNLAFDVSSWSKKIQYLSSGKKVSRKIENVKNLSLSNHFIFFLLFWMFPVCTIRCHNQRWLVHAVYLRWKSNTIVASPTNTNTNLNGTCPHGIEQTDWSPSPQSSKKMWPRKTTKKTATMFELL